MATPTKKKSPAPKKSSAKKPAAKKPAAKAGSKPAAPTAHARLALDRFLLGVWIDRDLVGYLGSKDPGAVELASLKKVSDSERPRAGERLRQELFGAPRPTDEERFEALLRQGVDCVRDGMPVLKELQHDLQAHVDVVGRDDARAEAMRTLAEYAMASQVNVAIQGVGRLAEATADRVEKARKQALKLLAKTLAKHPHLLP